MVAVEVVAVSLHKEHLIMVDLVVEEEVQETLAVSLIAMEAMV